MAHRRQFNEARPLRVAQTERRVYGRRVAREGGPGEIYRLTGRRPMMSRIQKARRSRTVLRRGSNMPNQWVVPYNPRIASEYNAHINAEVCSTVSAAHYLYKYVYNGPGRADVEIGTDAIAVYLEGRYFSENEDFWLLLDFDPHCMRPAVTRIHAHLEDAQSSVFRDAVLLVGTSSLPSRKRRRRNGSSRIQNTRKLREEYAAAIPPQNITCGTKARNWKPRKRIRGNVHGRAYSSSPLEGDLSTTDYFLLKPMGARRKSYGCIRNAPAGAIFEDFSESAASRGLLRDGKEYYLASPEASSRERLERCRDYTLPFFHTALQGRRAQCGIRFTPIFLKMADETLLRTLSSGSAKTYAPHGRRLRHAQPCGR